MADQLVDITNPKTDESYQGGLAISAASKVKQAALLEDSAYMYGASAFAQLASTKIDYDLLKINQMQRETQAQQIELQAKEQANLIRENFNQAIGNATVSAAQRGVKTTEGSIAKNIEDSSANLGKDVQKLDDNAKAKARMMRSQGKIDKRVGTAKAIGGVKKSGLLGYTGYGNYQEAKAIRKGI